MPRLSLAVPLSYTDLGSVVGAAVSHLVVVIAAPPLTSWSVIAAPPLTSWCRFLSPRGLSSQHHLRPSAAMVPGEKITIDLPVPPPPGYVSPQRKAPFFSLPLKSLGLVSLQRKAHSSLPVSMQRLLHSPLR